MATRATRPRDCPDCGSDDLTHAKPHPTVRSINISLCNSCGTEFNHTPANPRSTPT